MIKWFYNSKASTRRSRERFVHLPLSPRRGVTLVELMISMLILAVVCILWFKIIAIQSARREARRHEAVERLVGLMDASLYLMKKGKVRIERDLQQQFIVRRDGDFINLDKGMIDQVYPIFEGDVSSVGYRIVLTQSLEEVGVSNAESYKGWARTPSEKVYWLVGFLYDGSGNIKDVGRPFFTLPVFVMPVPEGR